MTLAFDPTTPVGQTVALLPEVVLSLAILAVLLVVSARHVTDRPGGWYQLGLSVESMYEPNSLQTLRFRQRVENAFTE